MDSRHWIVLTAVSAALFLLPVSASAATYDVSITHAGISIIPKPFFLNDQTRIYATVRNIGERDVEGSVFFSENGTALGISQPFSARAGGADEEVWTAWQPAVAGDRQIFIRIVTAPETRDEDSSNNEMIVPVFVDRDTDGDRIGDRDDPDDDNDGLPDEWEIARGLNPKDPADARLDPDGDGRSTLEEYRANTDPFKKQEPSAGGGLSAGGGQAAVFGNQAIASAPAAAEAKTLSAKKLAAPSLSSAKPAATNVNKKAQTLAVPPIAEPTENKSSEPEQAAVEEAAASPNLDSQLRELFGERGLQWRAWLPIVAGATALLSVITGALVIIRRKYRRNP